MSRKNWETMIVAQIPNLRRYARALTLDRESADELVQDSLERAWSRFSQWQAGTNLRAWLFTIMHNLYVNSVKKRINRPILVSIDEVTVAGRQHDPMLLRDLETALANLSDDQREVVILAGLESMKYEEIADITGIPVGTVMSRLYRGREKLRQLMSVNPVPSIKQIK